MITDFSKSKTILNTFLRELRDVTIQDDSMRFRRNLERIGEIIAYEISKTLEYESLEINTPLAKSKANLPTEQPVIATILRAGLPLHNGVLNYFDKAENTFISAYRKHGDQNNFEVEIEYLASPNIDGKTLILCDPMLATGSSMVLAFKAILEKGTPKKIHVVSVVASKTGIDFCLKNMPSEVDYWIGAIDKTLDSKSYIVPGLGDAGDLAYGIKE
ncbi:uracil phosphoribosyltransferase [Flavobacteriales bacterium]|jgi:uracil phosphoribosyltransferase|nr:uracil phosphoribosyltransferase [Flavobacteriales bacterium]